MEISWGSFQKIRSFAETIQLKILEIPLEKLNRIKISGKKFPKHWVNKTGQSSFLEIPEYAVPFFPPKL